MRFVTFQRFDYPEVGVVQGEEVTSLKSAGIEDMVSLIAGGQDSLMRVQNWLYRPPAGDVARLADVRLRAPILRPPKIVCVGLNYRDHAAEAGMQIPEVPTIFAKFPTAAIGSGEPIILPRTSGKPDYEAELGVVIGKRGRHIPPGAWMDYVFGYTNCNDVSARDYQMATSQWMIGKTFDTFAPMGPAIVTADEIADPHTLDISCLVNGERLQHSNTCNLIFPIPKLVEHLSSVFTLEPGDVILTGTPSGVGFSYKPPRWLQPGDEVVVTIEGLGELRNPVEAES